MKAILVRNTGGTYVATVHGASKFRASATEGEAAAARACATKWYGAHKASTLRRVTDRAELLSLFDPAHLPVVTGMGKHVFVFDDLALTTDKDAGPQARRGRPAAPGAEESLPKAEETLPKAEIVSCNALHAMVAGRAEEARKVAETACHYAVLLGCKLKTLKAATPHGGWEQMFTNGKEKKLTAGEADSNPARAGFAFSSDTALRYMKAAEGALARPGLAAHQRRTILALAAGPEIPETLPEPARKALDKAVAAESLTQLYRDLGIVRAGATERRGMGGNKRTEFHRPPALDEEAETWETITTHLNPVAALIVRGELAHLGGRRLHELEECLRGFLDEVKKISKR